MEEEARQVVPKMPELCEMVYEVYRKDAEIIEKVKRKAQLKAKGRENFEWQRYFLGEWRSEKREDREKFEKVARMKFEAWQNKVEIFIENMVNRGDENFIKLKDCGDSSRILAQLKEKMIKYNDMTRLDELKEAIEDLVIKIDLNDDLGYKRKKNRNNNNNNNKKNK